MAKKTTKLEVTWLTEVEEQDYPAAGSFLSLIYDSEKVVVMVEKFRKTKIVGFKAKDIFRASQLSLLGVSNSHVDKDSKKIRKGHALSPILLVRDESLGKVVIADGYHRLCAIYRVNEDAWIHCKII